MTKHDFSIGGFVITVHSNHKFETIETTISSTNPEGFKYVSSGDLLDKQGYSILASDCYIIYNNIGNLIEDVGIPHDFHEILQDRIFKIVIDTYRNLRGIVLIQE